MVAVVPVALALLAQATAAPRAAAQPEQAAAAEEKPRPQNESCSPPTANADTIVICTQRPQGYRINPDVLEAKRELKKGGPPPRPGGTVRPDCATVGPAPCVNAGINLIGAALTAAEMAKRVAKGQEIGSMFLTDPHPTEYQLYQAAKERREAAEAEKKAKAIAEAARARQDAAKAAQPQTQQPSGQ